MFIAGMVLGLFIGATIGALAVALAVAADGELHDSEPWRRKAETWDPAQEAFGESDRPTR